ncbi:citrate/2-methylcitrate synthase [Lacunimicrobium album]
MGLELYYPGLAGICVGETNIATNDGRILYRGYKLSDLVIDASFPEVVYLLLKGDLPNLEELADFHAILTDESLIDPELLSKLADLPMHVSLLDVMRTGIGIIGHHDPQLHETTTHAMTSQTVRLLAQLPLLIAARIRGNVPDDYQTDFDSFSYAGALYRILTGNDPSLLSERALEILLMITAASNFDASALSARMAVSNGGDLFAGILSAMSCFQGHHAGGMVERIGQTYGSFSKIDDMHARVERILLAGKTQLPGFGVTDYVDFDPRERLLRSICEKVAIEADTVEIEEAAEEMERKIYSVKRQRPCLDWTYFRLMHHLRLPLDLAAPLAAIGRLTGWAAHMIEQNEEGIVYAPKVRYRGATDLAYESIMERE